MAKNDRYNESKEVRQKTHDASDIWGKFHNEIELLNGNVRYAKEHKEAHKDALQNLVQMQLHGKRIKDYIDTMITISNNAFQKVEGDKE